MEREELEGPEDCDEAYINALDGGDYSSTVQHSSIHSLVDSPLP